MFLCPQGCQAAQMGWTTRKLPLGRRPGQAAGTRRQQLQRGLPATQTPCTTLPRHPTPIPVDNHPARLKGTASIPRAGKEIAHPPLPGRCWEGRQSCSTGQLCWQDPCVISMVQVTAFPRKISLIHTENSKSGGCDTAWHCSHAVGRRTGYLLSSWMNKPTRKGSRCDGFGKTTPQILHPDSYVLLHTKTPKSKFLKLQHPGTAETFGQPGLALSPFNTEDLSRSAAGAASASPKQREEQSQQPAAGSGQPQSQQPAVGSGQP